MITTTLIQRLDRDSFACRDRSCAPPPVGSGGSKPGGRLAPYVGMKPGDHTDPKYSAYRAKIDGRIASYLRLGKDTQSLHSTVKPNGARVYTPERRAQHKEIVDGIMARYKDAGKGEALVMGGLAGAGKSSFLKREGDRIGVTMKGGVPTSHVVINPDDVKSEMLARGMVPSYRGLKKDETAALTHEESSDITKQLIARVLKQNKNVIFDITLSGSDAGRLKQKYIDPLKERGYKVNGAFVESTVDQSLERATTRHQKPTASGIPTMSGRYVPLHLVEAARAPAGSPHLSVNHGNYQALTHEFDNAWSVGYADRALRKEK